MYYKFAISCLCPPRVLAGLRGQEAPVLSIIESLIPALFPAQIHASLIVIESMGDWIDR